MIILLPYLVIGFVILMVIRYFYTKSQDNSEIRNIKESEIAEAVNQLYDEFHIAVDESSSKENELDESNDVTDKLENIETVIVQTSKNKWLYPDDEFGKMEQGRSF